MDTAFRKSMWKWTVSSGIPLLILCVIYPITVTADRTSYEGGWLIFHFFVVIVASLLVRIVTYSANRAVASRKLAVDRANRGQQTRREGSTAEGRDLPENHQ